MSTPPQTVLTVKELASYLRVQPLTVYKHASEGRLPAFKIGARWRFEKQAITSWIQQQQSPYLAE